jgi:hypothetical protein
MAGKLTEVQAQHALNQVLQQISQTTDSYALGALAQALHAFPGKPNRSPIPARVGRLSLDSLIVWKRNKRDRQSAHQFFI